MLVVIATRYGIAHLVQRSSPAQFLLANLRMPHGFWPRVANVLLPRALNLLMLIATHFKPKAVGAQVNGRQKSTVVHVASLEKIDDALTHCLGKFALPKPGRANGCGKVDLHAQRRRAERAPDRAHQGVVANGGGG